MCGRGVLFLISFFAAIGIGMAAEDRQAEPKPVTGDVAPAGKDILTNGGFEEGLAGWEAAPGQSLVKEGRHVRSGAASLMGEVTEQNKALHLRRKVRVTAGYIYQLRLWAKATNYTKLVIFGIAPGGTPKERARIADFDKLPAKWASYDAVFTAEKDGEMELQIIAPSSFGADGRPGKIWLDDIELYESAPPAVLSLSGKEGFADEPSLALASDGSLYAAWTHFRNGSDSLRAARCRAKADCAVERVGEWDVVPPGKKTYLLYPCVVAAGDGAELVYSEETGEDDWDIFVARLGPEGAGAPARVTRGGGIDIKPAAAWDAGTLHIAWENNESGNRRIRLAIWKDGKAGALEDVSVGGSNYEPSVVSLGGEIAVAWHSFREGNYDIYLRRRASDGKWGDELRVTRSPGIDRHARLVARGRELWLSYETVKLAAGYRIGGEVYRRIHLVRVEPDGRLMAPVGIDASPLAGRCEGASLGFDDAGRLWVAHLRPQGRRDGWGAFAVALCGTEWSPLLRLSTRLGLDRTPGFAAAGGRAFAAHAWTGIMKQFDDEGKAAAADAGEVELCAIEPRDLPPASAMKMVPHVESEEPFEPAALRTSYGDAGRAPRSIEYGGKKLYLIYGDLHEHTDISQCNRLGEQTVDESYQHMRDIASLDFAAATDHGYNITPYLWNYTAKMARVNCDPGRFLTFLGEEWTSTFEEYSDKHPYGFYGHRNLILANAYFPRWWNERSRQTPADVWADLRKMKADFIHIPHQLADTGNVPTDWNYADETAQPVAEIFQIRGSYEYKGAPREAARSVPKPGYFLQDAWARGIVIGVIASPDHGGGLGKACVFTPELSRPAVLEALRQRHCFGTTAARVMLDVRVNGHLMGEKIPAASGPVEVAIRAICPGDIDRIEVCRNNEFIYTKPGGGAREMQFTFRDEKPVAGQSYYYVRLRQTDEEIAWSSPVWLGYP
ncbi:MAG TPA: hypothetical protein PLU30_09650 [Verrucomicrobiae bacterium]|nr:hypothetical protein [Verrucomicrobiae bacterium]